MPLSRYELQVIKYFDRADTTLTIWAKSKQSAEQLAYDFILHPKDRIKRVTLCFE